MHYIHDIDPVIIHLWGPLAIRWYGLAYIGGFVAGYFILNRRGQKGLYPLQGESLQSMLMAIVIGVLAGGRLGEMFFYDFANFISDPLLAFRLWEGGMASHGGIVGAAAGAWVYAYRQKISFPRVLDGLALVAPIGIGFGRIANFINGELWGRVATVPWAVFFPQEIGLDPLAPGSSGVIASAIENGVLQPRHPSQLYEFALEGLVLFAILTFAATKKSFREYPGRLSALFAVAYAALRFAVEFFREPDLVYFGWLSHGQALSLIILLPLAAGFWIYSFTAHRQLNK